jgi:hypothetical protein
VSWRLGSRPPQRQAQLEGAFEVANPLLEGLEVSLRGLCLSRAKDAQGCGDLWARTNGCILEAAQEAGLDVLRDACEGWRVDARKAGNEAGIHREWRGFAIRNAVFVHMSRKCVDWSKEMPRADLSRVICMPRSWDRAPKSSMLNRAPRRALKKCNDVVSLQAAGISST